MITKILLAALMCHCILAQECIDSSGAIYGKEGECEHYYQCSNGVENQLTCQPGTAFDPSVGVCNHDVLVPGCEPYDKEMAEHCKSDNAHNVAVPGTCNQYYQCMQGVPYIYTCANDLVFNPDTHSCSNKEDAPECVTDVTSTVGTPGGDVTTTETPDGITTTETPGVGVTTTETPGDGVTTTKSPGVGVTTTETPGDGVTTTKSPGVGVTTTETPGDGVTTTKSPGVGVTTTETPGDGVTTTKSPGVGVTTTETPGGGATTTKTPDPITTTSPEPPKGKSYVGFVVDDTGSMSKEIVAVKEWMTNCVNEKYEDCKNQPTGGWVLNSFNDPDVGSPVGPTTDLGVIINAIDKLYAHGGGDCPELAFAGLMNFASVIPDDASNCKVFFFSDATGKDTSKAEATKQLLSDKRCRFVPMLTGCCGECEPPCTSLDPEYCENHVVDDTTYSLKRKRRSERKRRASSGPAERLYYELAEETGGTIFLTDKPSSSDDFLDFLEEEATLGFCPSERIAGPPPLGYKNQEECNFTRSCWDSSVNKCYCMNETGYCPDHVVNLDMPHCADDEEHTYYPNTKNCTNFYQCSHGEMWEKSCAPGTVFDPSISNCNHPYNTKPPCGTLGL